MSLRWEIDNKVQAFKRWARQRLGRATGDQRHQVAGKPDRVVGHLKQPGGKADDASKH
ncbi:CsbD family protein [Nonomuraea turkmeniaca]|uniref:CsbD family protein n=1 Tax=Nonomuraea turkmeniaca TaxID=103838 RepID=A0A5S4EVR6_9ACTN|nr:CsbD family protein [Nonomuraea turkmeniaca]TMR07122.1 CsbD family protein [Nonomuraea turkmeniaca]